MASKPAVFLLDLPHSWPVFLPLMTVIRNFLYRFPRLRTNCPMDLIFGDQVILGTCHSLSESGLRGTVSAKVAVGTECILSLYRLDQTLQISSVVESARGFVIRVRFGAITDTEGLTVTEFIRLLAKPASPQRPR